jgi:acyl carrier protein
MTYPTAAHAISFDRFVAAIATTARVRAEDVSRATRLDEDLGLDSIAFAEVITLLIAEFGIDSLADDLERREWSGITVGALYDEACSRGAPP